MGGSSKYLNEKQILFIEHYLNNGFNATQAVLSAGYQITHNHAKVKGHTLLTNTNVKKIIDQRIKEKITDVEQLTLQWIEEVKALAFSDLREAANWTGKNVDLKNSEQISDIAAKSIESLSQTKEGVKVKLASKEKALELLGKFLCILNDNSFVDKKDKLDTQKRKERILELQKALNYASNRKRFSK